jgi:hypothetical protein
MKSIVKSLFAVILLGLLLTFGCLTAIALAQDYPYPTDCRTRTCLAKGHPSGRKGERL